MDKLEFMKLQARVATLADFQKFLTALKEVRGTHEQWSKLNCDDWLEGMITFVDGLDESDKPSWELLSDILLSGLERA